MFAPEGYVTVAQLWKEFVAARIDTIYHRVAAHYASEQFEGPRTRGSPLDICEHLFFGLMRRFGPVACTPEGAVSKLDVVFDDGEIDVFAVAPVYSSSYYTAAYKVEHNGDTSQIDKLGSEFFECWPYFEEDGARWQETYPTLLDEPEVLPNEMLEALRFHTLPFLLERGRYIVTDELPYWAIFLPDQRNVALLCQSFANCPLCIPETSLDRWQDYLSGAIPLLESDVAQGAKPSVGGGRPSKVDLVKAGYDRFYPDGHDVPLKIVRRLIEAELELSFSETTLKRAISRSKKERKTLDSSENFGSKLGSKPGQNPS